MVFFSLAVEAANQALAADTAADAVINEDLLVHRENKKHNIGF